MGAMDRERGRFEAPASTKKRWRQRQAPLLGLSLVAGVAVIVNAVSAHSPALWAFVGILLILSAGWVFGYPRYRRLRIPTGALWVGYGSVRMSDLVQAGIV